MKKATALLWLWIVAVVAAHLGVGAATPITGEDLGAFAIAAIATVTSSTLLATAIATAGALMLLVVVALRIAQRRGFPLLPTALALAALIATPLVAQPSSSAIVATVVNCLALLAALDLGDDYGLLLAVVLVNQSFVFAIALLFLVRRPLAPIAAAAWLWFSHWRPEISEWVRAPWSDFLHHPLDNALVPFTAAHIGLHVALLELLALAGWPLLVACAAALWAMREDIHPNRRVLAVAALAAAFVLQQLVIGAFDTPNDPRRALPALVALGIAWCWAAARLWPRRRWRIAVVAVLAACAFAVFADVLLKSPAIAYTATAQSIEAAPKAPVTMIDQRVAFERHSDWRNAERPPLPGALRSIVMSGFLIVLLWRLAIAVRFA